jgi:hypothetical protein
MMLFAFYGMKLVSLREEKRLGVVGNTVLKRMELMYEAQEWRKLRSTDLYNLWA